MDVIKRLEKTFKAIGDKNRLRILYMLIKKPLCVCEITSILHLSQSTISGHLKVLKEAEIVEDIKSGLFVEYDINKDNVFLNKILKYIEEEFKKEELVIVDIKKLSKANRYEICKK